MEQLHKKILLAVYDKDTSYILSSLLKAWGYIVIESPTAQNILDVVKNVYPDLIVLDAGHVNEKNLDICKQIKDDFLTAYIPIIVLIDKRQFRSTLLEIEQGIDDFLAKPPDPIDFQIRIALAIRNADHQCHANPLTKLPGNRSIESQIIRRIASKKPFTFAYLDIDNFKSFNDRYGCAKGDAVILQASRIMAAALKNYADKGGFLGHIGGDDFVYMKNIGDDEVLAAHIIEEFDRLMPLHYTKEDRIAQGISVKNRMGNLVKFPLMSVSIAIVNNLERHIKSGIELFEAASEIKKYLKHQHGSNYLIDRRRKDAGAIKRRPFLLGRPNSSSGLSNAQKAKPIGQLLLDKNLISESQLDQALNQHLLTGQRLGEVMVNLKFVNPQTIDNILKSGE